MSRYPDEVRSQALAMLQAEGYDATIRALGITKDTLYRWKREAGLNLTNRRSRKVNPEMLSHPEKGIEAAEIVSCCEHEDETPADNLTAGEPISDETQEDGWVADMMLLSAANEQLRARNAQLRKALVALLEH